MIRKIQRFIAEALFENILDEDYWMGIRQGHESTVASAILRLKNVMKEDVKKNNPGLERAIQSLEELR